MKKLFQVLLMCFLFVPCLCFSQDTFDFYISNKGNDGYPGVIKQLPKKTISATLSLLENYFRAKGNVKVGLKSGDIFEETLITSCPIQLGTYTDSTGIDGFAILNGSEDFSNGWTMQPGTTNVYERDIPYSGFNGYGINGIGSYSYIYVIAIDKYLEKAAPFSSRKILRFVSSLAEAENTPASFYSPINTNENPKKVYIHPVDDTSPNHNSRYRYEVTVRDWAVNSTYHPNNVFENLWVRGFGAGIGMLPGGDNSYYNKIVFGPGAAIHHLVVRSGTINHSLFLPGPKNTNDFAVVFYDEEGLGKRGIIKNSIFLDIGSPLYTHTSYGSNYGSIEMDNVVGFADTSEARGFMFTWNNDTILLNDVYAEGYLCGYNYGTAKYTSITNSYFKDVKFGIGYSAQNPVISRVDNVFIKTKGSGYTAGIYMQDNTSLTLTNSIVHIKNIYSSYFPNSGSFVYGTGAVQNSIIATGNIFVCDINAGATLIAANANTDHGKGTSKDKWNNNVYVLLKGNNIAWSVTNASTNGGTTLIQDFDEWKRQSGQDLNSLFFDLRNDPRGLKAIFADPDNGNYDLANTPEGRQVAALRAGMTSPLTCFLQKPSYEDAADIIRNNKTLSVNTCRNPCQENSIRVNNTFGISTLGNRQVKIEWTISEQQNLNHYEIQRAAGNSVLKKLRTVPVAVDSFYSYTDDVEAGIPYRYRLLLYPAAGGICYSDTRSVRLDDNKAFTIYPNPASGKIFISMNGYIGHAKVYISNSAGQMLFKNEFLSVYRQNVLDLPGLPGGLYFIMVETKDGTSIQKFLIQ